MTLSNRTNCVDDVEEIALDANDTVSFSQIGRINNNQIIVDNNVDLGGKKCILPHGYQLCAKGGIIKNGILVGDVTKIDGIGALFDKVIIKGTWNVPKVSTSMFVDLNYENSLKDVVALANPDIKNTIIVEKGDYNVRTLKNGDACISLCSNTDFILNGTIKLAANNYRHYNIIQAQGHHIRISGSGTVIGDKFSHTEMTGEWGMGVRFHKAINSSVKGIRIKECWGDCIYVGGNSKNITIDKCILDNGRRQGISVTKANGIIIHNCRIMNVCGANPQYAIDVEPNIGDTVDNVLIDNVLIKDCEGGIKATKSLEKKDGKSVSMIGRVTIKNCQIAANSKFQILLKGCNVALVENNIITESNSRSAIYAIEGREVEISNNTIQHNNNVVYAAKNVLKKMKGRKDITPIYLKNILNQKVTNNIFVTQ